MHESDTSTLSQSAAESYQDGEIDLRKYLDVMLSWWKEILVIALLGAALSVFAAWGLERLSPPTYRANADIIISRIFSEVTLDERVQTLTDDGSGANGLSGRRSALVQLAESTAIASLVVNDLTGVLPPERLVPGRLLETIDAEVLPGFDSRNPSDLIRITAEADSPEAAALIANTWAVRYVEQINLLFGQVPADVMESVQTELDAALAAYQNAQQELEAFIATSQVEHLTGQIGTKNALRTSILEGERNNLAFLIEQDSTLRQELYGQLSDAQAEALLQVFSEQQRALVDGLALTYASRNLASQRLDSARNLQRQLESGGESAGATSQLALQLLKTQVYALTSQVTEMTISEDESEEGIVRSLLPSGPDMQFSVLPLEPLSPAEVQADADALVDTLENYIAELDARIETQSDLLLSGESFSELDRMTIQNLAIAAPITATQEMADQGTYQLEDAIVRSYQDLFDVGAFAQASQSSAPAEFGAAQQALLVEIDGDIQALRAELAAEQAREQFLTQRRDLAWNTYDALSNKVAELSMERSAANREVQLGSPAIPPLQPVQEVSLRTTAVIGGAVGLVVGLITAFLANYMGYAPFFSRGRRKEPRHAPAGV